MSAESRGMNEFRSQQQPHDGPSFGDALHNLARSGNAIRNWCKVRMVSSELPRRHVTYSLNLVMSRMPPVHDERMERTYQSLRALKSSVVRNGKSGGHGQVLASARLGGDHIPQTKSLPFPPIDTTESLGVARFLQSVSSRQEMPQPANQRLQITLALLNVVPGQFVPGSKPFGHFAKEPGPCNKLVERRDEW